jgi:hypothetical protein
MARVEEYKRWLASLPAWIRRLLVEYEAYNEIGPVEYEPCRHYLFGQEVVRQERILRLEANQVSDSEWLEPRVAVIRQAWHITGFTTMVREQPTWFHHPAARILVLYPEWPNSYFKISQEERLRRIKTLSAPFSEADRLTALAFLLNPLNHSTGEKCIPEHVYPRCMTRTEILEAVDAWLQLNWPEQHRSNNQQRTAEPWRQQGRGSSKAAFLDDLNAIAAYRLCKIAKLPRSRVIALIRYPKGHKRAGAQVYNEEKALDKPLERFSIRLQKFRAELMANLTPLQPLELAQPDWTLLDQAIENHPNPEAASSSEL